MKIRTGFVSNSSSSSFVIAAVKVCDESCLTDYSWIYDDTIILKEGETHKEEAFNYDSFTLEEPGVYHILRSHADELESEWGDDVDFTEDNHSEIFKALDDPRIQVIKCIQGSGYNG